MPTSEKVEIDSARGIKIQAVLDLPADMPEAGYPLVVFAHGFQGSKEESGAFTDVAKGLAEQGIASLRLDFPGCGESQEDFMAYTLEKDVYKRQGLDGKGLMELSMEAIKKNKGEFNHG